MSLADQIIEHGRWNDTGRIMCTVEMAELNALRDELLELRRLRAAAEAPTGLHVAVEMPPDAVEKFKAMLQERLAHPARILRVPDPAAERCPSCDHLIADHSNDGCWRTVAAGTPGKDLVCPCSARHADEHTEGCR